MHDKAVRVRKMTDAQICDFITRTYQDGMDAGAKLAGSAHQTTTDGSSAAERFLDFLEERVGSGNRIGKGTIIYLRRELEVAHDAGIFGEQAK